MFVQTLSPSGTHVYVLAGYSTGGYADALSTIGKNIRAARKRAGIKTQAALAKRLDVAQPQLSDWENDRYDILDTRTLMKIAAAIPCTMGELVTGIDDTFTRSRDLLGHGTNVQGVITTLRGADATVEARLVELWTQIEERDARLREVQDVASRLVRIAAGPKDQAIGTGTSRRRGSRRATGR